MGAVSEELTMPAAEMQRYILKYLMYRFEFTAFVVVSFGLRRFFRIPWPVWRDMKKLYGRQYLKQEEIAKYKIPAPGGVIKLLDGVLDGGD